MSDTDGPQIPTPAEATDPDELGEEVGDEILPGTVGFPPTEPAGVGPSGSLRDLEHHDSVAERHRREEPEGGPAPDEAVRLIEPSPAGEADEEPELLAEAVPPVGQVSPEEAAMHVEYEEEEESS